MTEEQANLIIEVAEQLRLRPQMYFGDNYEYEDIVNFLTGFHVALTIMKIKLPRPEDKEDGWNTSFNYVCYPSEEQSKRLSKQEIIDKILLIEIDAWKTFLNDLIK